MLAPYGMNSARIPGAEIMYFALAPGPEAPLAMILLLDWAQLIDASRGTKRKSLLDHILNKTVKTARTEQGKEYSTTVFFCSKEHEDPP